MEVKRDKNLARLFALFLSWVLLVAYLIWGFWRNLSFLTLVWSPGLERVFAFFCNLYSYILLFFMDYFSWWK